MSARDRHIPVAYGQGYTKLCKLCKRRIWLCPKADGSGWMALDLKPTAAGNVLIDSFGRALVPSWSRDSPLYVAHQATCPPYLERQRQRTQDADQMRLGDDP